MSVTTIERCRICASTFLPSVIDLGAHCLHGQFISENDPDPPRVPIQVVRCPECGVMQMRHSVSEAKVHFEKYFYRCIGGGQRLFAKVGGKIVHDRCSEIFGTKKPVALPCVGLDGSVEWREVSYRNSGKQKLYTIYFHDGSKVVASGNHRWQLMGSQYKGELRWRKDTCGNSPSAKHVIITTEELKSGDRIPRMRMMPRPTEGVDEGAIYGYDAGYFVGAWFAEGSDDANPYAVKLTTHVTKDAAMLDRINKYITGDLHENFHDCGKHKVHESRTAYISGPVMYAILRKFVVRDHLRRKVFTNQIWEMPRKFIEGVIDGWLDGDGCHYKESGHWQVNFVGTREVVEDFALMCNILGYSFRYCFRRGTQFRPDRRKNYITAQIRKDRSRSRQSTSVGNVGVVYIDRIEEVPKDHDTYDVCVGGSELFALGNGIVTHNSSVSTTMKAHLKALVLEASEMLEEKVAPRVLSLGGNDAFELDCIPFATGQRVLVDPSDVPVAYPGVTKVQGLFPQDFLLTQQFDLVMAIACFYSVPDPVGFVKAVKKILSEKGIFVCEVADQGEVLRNNAYDFFCAEHQTLLSPCSMTRIATDADLRIIRMEPSDCNGGSMRYYLTHKRTEHYRERADWNAQVGILWSKSRALADNHAVYERFASQVTISKSNLKEIVAKELEKGGKIHALAASTKGNVILQYCGLDNKIIEAASDRDPRKVGLVTPGTRIEIISEEESRSRKPTMYICPVSHFRDEILKREKDHLDRGGKIVFPLPQPEIVTP